MAVSLAALVTSGASIALALHNGQSMERLVTANSWPFPLLDNSNFVDGKTQIVLSIRNSGSGPAKLESVVMRYRSNVVERWPDLMRACCTDLPPGSSDDAVQESTGYVLTSTPTGKVLLPGDEVLVLSVARTDENAAAWNRLNTARYDIAFEACYCSVFDDCWTTNLQTTRPTPVAQCPAPSGAPYKG